MKSLEDKCKELRKSGWTEEDIDNYYAAMSDQSTIFDYTHR